MNLSDMDSVCSGMNILAEGPKILQEKYLHSKKITY
ncbi:hypothetical protein IMSAGC022_00890 [Alistipes sp.]|nr:hypothetical protein IMSAGC022_00890 [Alistipes sp.]